MSAKDLVRRRITRYSMASRARKARVIDAWMTDLDCRTVLLIGYDPATPDLPNSNIVEDAIAVGRQVVMTTNVVSVSTDLPFEIADARSMPFQDAMVDFALANAIIEHVGDGSDQAAMVAECCRVARTWAITTPNKWFPIESHTAAVLVHWIPAWRRGRSEFTRLLSLREFTDLVPEGTRVLGHWWSPTFTALWSSPGAADGLAG